MVDDKYTPDEYTEDILERAGNINPNMKSSGHLAIDRFKMAMSLNPAKNQEVEEFRNKLTEEESFPPSDEKNQQNDLET